MIRILRGDCRDVLRTLPDESVHCVVTSPPYWGLRDYGTAKWESGDPGCDHVAGMARQDTQRETPEGHGGSFRGGEIQFRTLCNKCGARRIDSQIGLEATPAEFIEQMVAVFRQVRRVLRSDGVCFINMGDSYFGGGRGGNPEDSPYRKQATNAGSLIDPPKWSQAASFGLKPKDLCGMPWRLAFALQADGWWLRQDIIWSKKNCMPESVIDRCCKSHEYLFLLTKSARYYFDNIAIAERSESALSQQSTREGQTNGISKKRRRQDSTSEMAGLAVGSNVAAEISAFDEAQISLEELLRERQGQGGDSSISGNGQGQGVPTSRHSQAPIQNGNDDLRSDCRSMEGNQKGAEFSVRPLRAAKGSDERSYHSALDGRTAHGIEYSSPVPKLQQPEEQQTAFRARRSVWHLATEPFRDSHFATMPTSLVEPCILAGCPAKCCAKCGAPWVREVEVTAPDGRTAIIEPGKRTAKGADGNPLIGDNMIDAGVRGSFNAKNGVLSKRTLGFSPSCKCPATNPYTNARDIVAGRVLDPFGGAGTTGLVADRLGRNAVLIELNPEYAAMAERRIHGDSPLFAEVGA